MLTKFLVLNLMIFSYFQTLSAAYRPTVHTLAKYAVTINYPEYEYIGDSHFCAGTVLSPRKIVTAAHCLTDK